MTQSDLASWTKDQEEDVELVDTEMIQLKGLGPKSVSRLEDAGIDTIDKLEEACRGREVQKIHGLGSKTERKLIDEIKLARKGIYERKPWEVAHEILKDIMAHLTQVQAQFGRAQAAGSYRRGKDTVGDLDVLIEGDTSEPIYNHFEDWDEVDQILVRGDDKMTFRIGMMQIDLEVVPTKSYGAALMYFTGSKGHNMVVRGIAKSQGYKLDEWGLWDRDTDEYVAGKTEKDVYDELHLEYLKPEDRQSENVSYKGCSE